MRKNNLLKNILILDALAFLKYAKNYQTVCLDNGEQHEIL
jgi:hypothetical protein